MYIEQFCHSFDKVSETYNDEDITPSYTHNDTPLYIQGPITKARARQLNLEVSSFLNMILRIYCYMLYLRIKERTRELIKKGLEAWRTSKNIQTKIERPSATRVRVSLGH